MSTNDARRRRRMRLFRLQDGNCAWCGCSMTVPSRREPSRTFRVVPSNAAVLLWEHRIVVCIKCARAREQTAQDDQSLEKRWAESGAYPLGHPLHVDMREKWTRVPRGTKLYALLETGGLWRVNGPWTVRRERAGGDEVKLEERGWIKKVNTAAKLEEAFAEVDRRNNEAVSAIAKAEGLA